MILLQGLANRVYNTTQIAWQQNLRIVNNSYLDFARNIKVCALGYRKPKHSLWILVLAKCLGFVLLTCWNWLFKSSIKWNSGISGKYCKILLNQFFEALRELLYFCTKLPQLTNWVRLVTCPFISLIFKSVQEQIYGKYFGSCLELYKVITFLFSGWPKFWF